MLEKDYLFVFVALGEEPGKDGPTACWPCCLPDVHVLLQLGLGPDGAVGEGRAAGNGAVAWVRVRDRGTEEEALEGAERRRNRARAEWNEGRGSLGSGWASRWLDL